MCYREVEEFEIDGDDDDDRVVKGLVSLAFWHVVLQSKRRTKKWRRNFSKGFSSANVSFSEACSRARRSFS